MICGLEKARKIVSFMSLDTCGLSSVARCRDAPLDDRRMEAGWAGVEAEEPSQLT